MILLCFLVKSWNFNLYELVCHHHCDNMDNESFCIYWTICTNWFWNFWDDTIIPSSRDCVCSDSPLHNHRNKTWWNCQYANLDIGLYRNCKRGAFFWDPASYEHTHSFLCRGHCSRGTMKSWSRIYRSRRPLVRFCEANQLWFHFQNERKRTSLHIHSFPYHRGRFSKTYFYTFQDGKTLQLDYELSNNSLRNECTGSELHCL